MNEEQNSRRDAIQKLSLFSAALFLPLTSCDNPKKEIQSNSKPTKAPLPFLIPPKATLEVGPMGSNMRTLIRSEQTNRQFSCVEAVLAPKKMAGSPHKHDDLDELMYFMEGTASILMGEEVVEVTAGSWHLRPRGIVHVVWNSGNENLRLIDMYCNQNFEEYLEELYHKIIPDAIARNVSFNDPKIARRVAELDKQFGLTYYHEKSEPLMKKYGLTT
ncbi:cupin domain-containing protein [Flavobacterium sp.]|uniref:cupin domain-containing protein n=1 Tax=Flavobacterium sp. TaxID=239 RepID=UPI00121E3BB9|nr:cupin domain-containing protein [Flavobacterium sp.]RZJ69193.1 MAG: cupin domain-containing protein [Flavobacterium sp.]